MAIYHCWLSNQVNELVIVQEDYLTKPDLRREGNGVVDPSARGIRASVDDLLEWAPCHTHLLHAQIGLKHRDPSPSSTYGC